MNNIEYEERNKRISAKIIIINKLLMLVVGLVFFSFDLSINKCFAGLLGLSLQTEPSATAVDLTVKKNIPQNMLFRHLNVEDGLVQNNVISIFQDSKGFMWFGTENGLSRYDGYDFVNYDFDADNKSGLYSPIILSITEDTNGIIWIATEKGLNSYNPILEKFQRHAMELSGDTDFNRIYTVKSAYKRIWLGTDNGLYQLLDNRFVKVSQNTVKAVNIDKSVYAINDNQAGTMWLITGESRLLSYTIDNGEYHEHRPEFHDKSVVINDIEYFQAELWIATSDGVYTFDWQSNSLYPVHGIAGKNAKNMSASNNDSLYLYADDLIYKITAKNKIISYSEPYLSKQRLRQFYSDNLNNLWVSVWAHGISLGVNNSEINYFSAKKDSHGEIEDRTVYSVDIDQHNRLWLANDDGVMLFDTGEGRKKSFDIGKTYQVYVASSNIVWAVTDNSVYYFHVEKNQFISVGSLLLEQGIRDEVHFVGEGADNELLIVTERGVFQIGNEWQLQFYPFVNSAFEPVAIIPLSITRTSANNVYVTSENGIYKFSGDKWFLSYGSMQGNINLQDLVVAQVIEDEELNLWIVTDGRGLIKLADNGTYKQFLKEDGLLDNTVRSIYQVGQDIWVGSDKGVMKIVKNHNDYTVQRFFHPLLRSELTENAVVYDKENVQLYFAGVKGVVAFNPFTYEDLISSHNLQLTEFRLFNNEVVVGNDLPSSILFAEQLVLQYRQNIFSLTFSSFDYSNPRHYYSYRLNGLGNGDWVTTDYKNRRAVYTNLDPGDYVFEVRAGRYPGEWCTYIKSLGITIMPPWYMTLWAYVFYVMAVISSIVFYIHWRTLSLKRRAWELEQEVVARTDEISSQKNTIERLMDKKNEMFANISHELRTPLTLINGPIDKVAKKLDDSSADKKNLSLAKRNTQRLSYLVDQLLQLSRMYYLQEEKKVPQSVSMIAEQLCASFQAIADIKSISISCQAEPDVWVDGAQNSVETLLINLISNGFKYTPENGNVRVVVKRQQQQAVIIVEDSGIGIPEEKLKEIFDRFTRLEEGVKTQAEGVGVGLAIVKQLLELLDGDIQVESKVGEFTRFVVHLPISTNSLEELRDGNKHLGQDMVKQIDFLAQQFADKKPSEKNQVIEEGGEHSKPCLLIIDDTPDMREYLQDLLSDDYNCLLAEDGEAGLAKAKSVEVDIVISDVMMPVMDGFQLLDALRNDVNTSHLPVLLLTAKGDRESRIKGFNKLADDYITKPFDAEELMARLHSILSIRRLQQLQTNQMILSSITLDAVASGEWADGRFQSINSGQESLLVEVSSNEKVEDARKEGGSPLPGIDQLNLNIKDQEFLDKLTAIVHDNYQHDNFNVENLAEQMCMSVRTLQMKSKALLGHGPQEFLREYRLNKAKELIRKKNINIGQLADLVGFSSHSHFSRCFKAYVGFSPKEYQLQLGACKN